MTPSWKSWSSCSTGQQESSSCKHDMWVRSLEGSDERVTGGTTRMLETNQTSRHGATTKEGKGTKKTLDSHGIRSESRATFRHQQFHALRRPSDSKKKKVLSSDPTSVSSKQTDRRSHVLAPLTLRRWTCNLGLPTFGLFNVCVNWP